MRLSDDAQQTCPDCGALEGQLHEYFPHCDMEICPVCLEQLLSCPHATQLAKVRRRGRIPYLCFPVLCVRCGAHWPEFFMVSNHEWHQVMPRSHWDTVICRPCYDYIKDVRRYTLPQKPRAYPVADQGHTLLLD